MQDGQLPAVGFSDIFFSKHFGRISESDQALIEQGYTTKIFRNGREIVVDDQDGFALRCQALQNIGDLLFSGDIYADEGFVEQKDLGFLAEGSGQENPLLLAAGKFAD